MHLIKTPLTILHAYFLGQTESNISRSINQVFYLHVKRLEEMRDKKRLFRLESWNFEDHVLKYQRVCLI